MWWPYIPWLLLLLVLSGTYGTYRIRQWHSRRGSSAATGRRPDWLSRKGE